MSQEPDDLNSMITSILDGTTDDPDGAAVTGVTFTVAPYADEDGDRCVELCGARVDGLTGLCFDGDPEDALRDLLTRRRAEADAAHEREARRS